MKTRRASLVTLLLATLGTASLSNAEEVLYKLDPVHSMVVFTIGHLGVSNPFGIFHAPEGSVTVNDVPALDITLQLDKLDMGNEMWEKDIKAASWFDAKQFPTITFKSTAVKKTGDMNYEATGDMTVHGVTKPVTVTLTKTGEGKGMKGETRIGYSTTFKIKRSDFGMTTYVGPIGDEVTLMVNIEAIQH